MFPYRMALWPTFASPSPWLITLIYYTAVTLAVNLPRSTSDYVPGCAQECFASFVAVSYGNSGCGSSFQCLCSQTGASGFTMGEGALQCIVAERSVGYCSEQDANDDVVYNAYSMCSNEPDAVEPTHKVITATLVIPTSGGVVSFPPLKTTTRYTTAQSTFVRSTTKRYSTEDQTTEKPTSIKQIATKHTSETPSMTLSSFTSLPTTLVMETSSEPPIPTTKSSRTTSSKSTSTSASTGSESSTDDPMSSAITLQPTTATSTAAEETSTDAAAGASNKDDDGDDNGKHGLTQKQIAGISVGALAAAGLAIGAIVLARRTRKKRYPEMQSGFLPIRDTWGYKPDPSDSAGGSSWNANSGRRSFNPFPKRPAPPAGPTSGNNALSANTIGLAVSPSNSGFPSRAHTRASTPSRRMSRLLPAKPVLPFLPLNVPGNRSPERRQSEWPRIPEQHVRSTRQSRPPQLPPLQIGPAASSPATYDFPRMAVPKLQIPEPELPAPPHVQATTDSAKTGFEENKRASSMSATGQVWRPPPTPVSNNMNTYYVADEHGNWKLGDPKHASRMSLSQHPVPQTIPEDCIQAPSSGSSKTGSSKSGSSKTGSSKTLEGTEPVSSVSDEVTKRTLAPAAEIIPDRTLSARSQKPMGPRAQPSPPIISQQFTSRRPSSKHYSGRNLTRSRTSAGSDMSVCTTISDSSEGTIIDPSPSLEQQGSLSPVQESPNSARSRAKVPYPTIPPKDPRRRSVPALRALEEIDPNKRSIPPPKRPMIYNPPGQPSPTLGAIQPPVGPSPASNWVPKSVRKPMINPGLERTGSPTMRMVQPSPSPEDENQYHSQQGGSSSRTPPFYFAPPFPKPLNPRPSQRQHQYSNSTPQYPTNRPLPNPPYRQQPNQSQRHSHQAHAHQWHPLRASQMPPQAPASNVGAPGNSSLLAKRLGNERAAQLAIPTEANRTPWQRNENSYVAPPPPPPPGPTRQSRQEGSQPWMPTLTPTRRGRDLFLNVQ